MQRSKLLLGVLASAVGFLGCASNAKAVGPINCSSFSSSSTISNGNANGWSLTTEPAGTVFKVVISVNLFSSQLELADSGLGGNILSPPSTSVLTYTYDGVPKTIFVRFSNPNNVGTATVNWSCSAPAASSSSASKVRSLQLAGTQVSSTTAANSLATGIASNVGNRLPLTPGAAPNAGVGSPSFLGARNKEPSVKDSPAEIRPARAYNVWGDIKQSGFDRDDQASLKQISAMGGLDFLLNRNLLLGVMGGYEHSDFKAEVLQGTLKGNGSTFGIYGGYRFTPSIRGDLATTWTWLDYDVSDNSTATPVTANFGAIRNMIAGGLTGSYMLDGVVMEPSSRVMYLRQKEEAYTESSGAAQDSRNFSAGRASIGSKFSLPYSVVYGGLFASPYTGLYGDYKFGSDTSMTEAAAVLGLQNGWSARTTAGISLSLNPETHSLTIGGELGGLGSDTTSWTWGARGSLKF